VIVALPTVVFLDSARGGPSPPGNLGRVVFAKECSSCHTLTVEAPTRLSGGSLRGYRLTAREIASFARVMPARVPLTPREVIAVSRYVAKRERPSGG
jgi:mono/diheme cytochrome c family protein